MIDFPFNFSFFTLNVHLLPEYVRIYSKKLPLRFNFQYNFRVETVNSLSSLFGDFLGVCFCEKKKMFSC